MTVFSAGGNLFGRSSSARSPFAGWEESFEETLVRLAFLVLLVAGFAALLLALIMVAREAYPALFARSGLWGLLIADPWEPLSQPARLGVRHAWLSTLAVTSIALAVAAPLGFGIGIFIAEIAPRAIKKMLQPCLELLAGIPSVVYGFFGYVTLVPWFESTFEMATGESLLAAGLILAVMILPFVASTSAEALSAVPFDVKEAALALGVNRCCMTLRVLVRHAAPGMFAALALGLARALGETFAVLMLAGNSVVVPVSL
ncbi:MAG TPA: phosphate ABC transporter permease subunit PstC, partial [Candidatus Saccharimonadales bacterium]|nr:phosphate ABC transporter permease subunit PstC [Candidatus Saccharimonadales bacterium]